jgi:Ran GTPase-activating protein (RanGAP) involved in mRNA processing and transport
LILVFAASHAIFVQGIKKLDISSNHFGGDGVKWCLSPLLKNVSWLCRHSYQGLSHSLLQGKLSILDISHNKLYSEGGKHLAAALQHSHELVELNIANNGLGKESEYGSAEPSGMADIMIALRETKTLSKVNLLGNHVSVEQARELIAILHESKKLATLCGLEGTETGLELSKQHLTAGCTVLLVHEIKLNGSLAEIDLSNNRLSEDGARKLCNGLLEKR